MSVDRWGAGPDAGRLEGVYLLSVGASDLRRCRFGSDGTVARGALTLDSSRDTT